MIVTRDPRDLPSPGDAGSVVSVGVFDGVHLGHQAILSANVARARSLSAAPTVVTFQQHPKSVLLGRSPRTLTTLEHRLELFRRAGIEHTLALTFDEQLRRMPAERFARDLLVERLAARSFVLGFDSKFGENREGGPEFLRELGFDVEVVSMVVVARRAVSSTAIREAVELGDLEGAAGMLGRPVTVFGEVVHGAAVGRTLGFPTANLDLHHELHPPTGVYACRVRIPTSDTARGIGAGHPAVANIGFRPTITGERPSEPLVEVHLIGFEGDLYGEHLELEFVRNLRPERRFDGPEALKAQIAQDVEAALELLGSEPESTGDGEETAAAL